jgi:uncharacterized OsmC-like protein
MERIRDAILRVRQLLQLKPERGRRTVTTQVAMHDGLRCIVTDGSWTVPVGMSANTGGDGTAPDPGVYARAAIGACVAIAYRLWAAAEGITLRDVAVEVQADNDAAGLFGTADVRPSYRAMRLLVSVTSDADEATVLRVLEQAEAHSPYLDLFRHGVPVDVTRAVRASAPLEGVTP